MDSKPALAAILVGLFLFFCLVWGLAPAVGLSKGATATALLSFMVTGAVAWCSLVSWDQPFNLASIWPLLVIACWCSIWPALDEYSLLSNAGWTVEYGFGQPAWWARGYTKLAGIVAVFSLGYGPKLWRRYVW